MKTLSALTLAKIVKQNMNLNFNKRVVTLILAIMLLFVNKTFSQFTFDGQIIQRSEFRNGFGKLIEKNDDPAFFISQRARLQAMYKLDKLDLYISFQDVRTWGNTPQVKLTDPFLSVHEAWAETKLDSLWSLKLGRQELNYDNVRFLGNLDWALQGRSHDFALIKFEKNKMKLHFGGGFNQTTERLSGNIFSDANQYKSAQMIRLENAKKDISYSFLFWNNGKQFVNYNSQTQIINKGVRYSQTLGLSSLKFQKKQLSLFGFYYTQLGKDVNNKKMKAYDASVNASYVFNIDKTKEQSYRLTAGMEILSGTASNNSSNVNRSFSPMYGTNHAHNGYMDFFYVGGRQENSTGLIDFYLRNRLDLNSKLFLSLNGHLFYSNADIFKANISQKKYFGTELDFSLGLLISNAVSLQGGYSQMFASDTFKYVQNSTNPSSMQNWAYLMMIYRPKMKNKFIGLIF